MRLRMRRRIRPTGFQTETLPAGEELADKAAVEVAGYENRLGSVESAIAAIRAELAGLNSRVSVLTWAVGLNVAMTLAVLARVFIR